MTEEVNLEEFRKLVLSGMTVKALQSKYSITRSAVYLLKNKLNLIGLSPNSKKLDRTYGLKVCNNCGIEKSLEDFYSNGKTSSGLIKYKPSCILCENKKNRDNFYTLIKEYLHTLNKQYACEKCSVTGPEGFLDFHHLDSSTKEFTIGEFPKTLSTETFINKVIPEMQKCILLCPNCHRLEHLVMG